VEGSCLGVSACVSGGAVLEELLAAAAASLSAGYALHEVGVRPHR
jgi:hypothetical protein